MRWFLAVALLTGCAHQPGPGAPTTDALAWLAGDWLHVDGTNASRETWVILNRQKMVGTSQQLQRGRIVFREDLQIVAQDGTLLYRADPEGQSPHAFPMVAHGDSWVRFEDPNHDWPQVIEYRLRGRDLTAVVSGRENGTSRTATFTWTRVESPSQ